MKSLALGAGAAVLVLASSGPVAAQSTDALLQRLEAKVDALAKENSELRERVRKMESSKPKTAPGAAPVHAASGEAVVIPAAARSAQAAYMPVKAGPAYRAPCARFAGWYGGAHVGYAQHDKTWVDRSAWVDNFSTDWTLGSVETRTDGIHGGLQGGYNWQSGCSLLGFEVDVSWADLGSNKNYSSTAPAPGTVLNLNSKIDWFGTLRGRAGVVVDNLLLYVTGGAAFADIKHTWTVTDPINATESFSSDANRWGFVVGGGAEWALTETYSVKAEALYLKFTEQTVSGFSPAGAPGGNVDFDLQDSIFVARLGLNVKFGDYGWGKGPVTAKY